LVSPVQPKEIPAGWPVLLVHFDSSIKKRPELFNLDYTYRLPT